MDGASPRPPVTNVPVRFFRRTAVDPRVALVTVPLPHSTSMSLLSFDTVAGRSNVSYGSPVLQAFPGLQPTQDLYVDPRQEFTPLTTSSLLVASRQHRNLATLSPFALPANAVDTLLVTDCTVHDTARLTTLLATLYPGVANLNDAISSANMSALTYQGYVRIGAPGFVDYRGGGLYFMKDPQPNAFNPGLCTVWQEPLVNVGTDDHWVAFTGLNFAAGFESSDLANARLVIDGVIQPVSSIKVRDHELIEVLLPAFLGRRRIQVRDPAERLCPI